MKWLNNWFNKKCKQALQSPDPTPAMTGSLNKYPSEVGTIRADYNDLGVINLRIYSAIGGNIVESTKYNRATDREQTSRYVLMSLDHSTLGEQISNIITMESMKT